MYEVKFCGYGERLPIDDPFCDEDLDNVFAEAERRVGKSIPLRQKPYTGLPSFEVYEDGQIVAGG